MRPIDSVQELGPMRYEIDDNLGCWNITSHSLDSDGYPQLAVAGKKKKGHRLAYELVCGEIPSGMCILHSCDNRRCINPAHLWVGTVAENNRDAHAKGRSSGGSLKGERNHKAKLTAEQVIYIRQHPEINNCEMGRMFGVCDVSISDIRLYKHWRHIETETPTAASCVRRKRGRPRKPRMENVCE